MELYTLDGLLRRTEIVEGFESFIWAERYSSLGDIQVVTPSTTQFRNLLAQGTALGLSESMRVMRVNQIQDTTNDDGDKTLTVLGSEIFDVAKDRITGSTTTPVDPTMWRVVGKASDIIRALFDYGLRNGLSRVEDKIPLLVAGSLYAPGNLPEDTTVYTIERPFGELYSVIEEFANAWDLGFRLYKGNDDGRLYFDVYKGNDRTTGQSTLPAVIFSPDMDTLKSVTEYNTNVGAKNVAVVKNDFMTVTVYSIGTDPSVAGFARREMFVDASDITFTERVTAISDEVQVAINKAIAFPQTLTAEKAAYQRILQRIRFNAGQLAMVIARTNALLTAGLITSAERTVINDAANAHAAVEPAEWTNMQNALIRKGEEELAKARSVSAFDGEVPPASPYQYNVHYSLGDLTEMRDSEGLINNMLVTEQIFVSDESGEKAYPTLVTKQFITPGSWLAWETSQEWVAAPGTWSTS